jgi:hypothetical protein
MVATHLSPTTDRRGDCQRYVEGAKKFFSGPIVVAKDLMRFSSRSAVSGPSALWLSPAAPMN